MASKNIISKIDPKFRKLTDLLFFSDRDDLNVSDYKLLLKQNYSFHSEYFFDRFYKACEISWESSFWEHRFSFIRSLKNGSISRKIDLFILKRLNNLFHKKGKVSASHDIEYIQFLQLCKSKMPYKNDIKFIKNFLSDLSNSINFNKLIELLHSVVPNIFSNVTEYFFFVSKKCKNYYLIFKLFKCFLKRGIHIDYEPILKMMNNIVDSKSPLGKNRRANAFFYMLEDDKCLSLLKKENLFSIKNVTSFLTALESKDIEGKHFQNIKNLINLDPALADEIANIYLKRLYARTVIHKKANSDKIIRMLKLVPEISAKKVIFWLSNNKKLNDIKYLLQEFPNLKNLAAFI